MRSLNLLTCADCALSARRVASSRSQKFRSETLKTMNEIATPALEVPSPAPVQAAHLETPLPVQTAKPPAPGAPPPGLLPGTSTSAGGYGYDIIFDYDDPLVNLVVPQQSLWLHAEYSASASGKMRTLCEVFGPLSN